MAKIAVKKAGGPKKRKAVSAKVKKAAKKKTAVTPSRTPRAKAKAGGRKGIKRPGKKLAPAGKAKVAPPAKKPQPAGPEIGKVIHYFNKIAVGIIKLSAELKVGDTIHVRGAHDDFQQPVESMQYNHKDIPSAGKGKEIGIKVIQKVHENDRVYKIS